MIQVALVAPKRSNTILEAPRCFVGHLEKKCGRGTSTHAHWGK